MISAAEQERASLLGPNTALFGQSTEVGSSCVNGSSVCRFLRRLWRSLTSKKESKEERATERRQEVVMSLLFCEAMMKMRRSHERALQELGREGVEKKMWDFINGGGDSEWSTLSEWTISQQLTREASSSSKLSSRSLASDDPGSTYEVTEDQKSASQSMEFFSPTANSYEDMYSLSPEY